MAGRHRRVGGEDDVRGDDAQRFVRRQALALHPLPRELERREGAVAFVQVGDAGRVAERPQRPRAADAEQQLLADAGPLVAAVEPRRQLAVLGRVAFDIRVEQEQRAAPHRHGPYARRDRAGAGLDADGDGAAVLRRRRTDRQRRGVDVEVLLLLAHLVVEALPEVALVVVEADADQRDAEVGGRLDVIAGQDAEAARVDRQRLVQPELGGEVGDRPRPQDAGVAFAPGVARPQIFLEASVGVVDAAVQGQLRGALVDGRDRQLLQQRDRIVPETAPQAGIEVAEQAGRVLVPAPPQVAGQAAQALLRRRDELPLGAGQADDVRELVPGRADGRDHGGIERPRGYGLHHQHALQQAAVDERDAEERAIRILAGVLEVLEARMRGRVVHDQRPQLLGDEADQAFVEPHADPADAIGLQADGGGEDQVRAVRAEQVDGADVGAEAALNELDDVGQRLGGVAGHRGEAADVVERPGGRRRGKRGGVAHGLWSLLCRRVPSGPAEAASWRTG